jgi:hypothetical protein
MSSPLLESKNVRLYDADCLVSVNDDIVYGLLIILGGPSEQSLQKASIYDQKSGLDEDAINLGFLAITEGNVLDACFGGHVMSAVASAKGASSPQVQKQVKMVKSLLLDAADHNDDIRRLAVSTYRSAFFEVRSFHKKVSHLNFITRCFFYHKYRAEAHEILKTCFANLEEVIQNGV